MSNKLHPKHRIDQNRYDEIMTIVRALPPIVHVDSNGNPKFTTTRRLGRDCKPSDLSPGTKLIPNATYQLREYVFVDHERACVELFKAAGMKSVMEYQSGVLKHKNRTLQKVIEMNNQKLGLWGRLLIWLKISK